MHHIFTCRGLLVEQRDCRLTASLFAHTSCCAVSVCTYNPGLLQVNIKAAEVPET